MSAESPLPTMTRATHIIDLTEDMSDLDADQESGAEDNNVNDECKGLGLQSKKRKARKGRRGGKSKKTKAPEKAEMSKLTEDVHGANASGADVTSTIPLAKTNQSHKLPKLVEHISAPNFHVPVLPHYEIRALPRSITANMGTCTKKHGVFATKDIAAGTRIIYESPQITLTSPGDQVVELTQAFYTLTQDQQHKIWSLNPVDATASPLLTYMGEQIATKIMTLKRILTKPEDQYNAEDIRFLTHDVARLSEATKMFRLAARWHAGRHSLYDLPDSELKHLPPGTPITGLFVETARLRHSCVPNCSAHYIARTNSMIVHTAHRIPAGTELTLSTIDAVYYLSASERAAELFSEFGVTCNCEACDPSHPSFTMHETSRLSGHTRALQLEHFCTLLTLLSPEPYVLTDLYLSDSDRPSPPELEDLNDAEGSCRALIGNLKDTGCEGPELIRWNNVLIDRIQPLAADFLTDEEKVRWWKGTVDRAQECVDIAKTCFGADSIEVAQTQLRTARIQRLIDEAEERIKMAEESKKKGGVGRKKYEEKQKKKAALEKVAKKLHDAEMATKNEWEIVGSAVKKDVDEDNEDEDKRGQVIILIGNFPLSKE